ncbi:two-component sensor histidine kinase [Clostridium sp. CM028]|uniref:sensor histidine kinase n=2 Tax=unclassified Clostridium TaxID=2614128 RepID=UPI001C6E3374|nr:histidine kinase [Clostridium sp. CM028]MBW9149617.1 two-component sensor histidine kinase [Clostridium sp. CM028]WLC61573.1 two-component sensor histidine kinase [Clostridium sp. CM028]
MENWIILNKLILLIYVSSLLVKGNFDYPCSNYIVIISLLFYVIINVSKSLISNNKCKLIFLSISILELLICNFFVTPIFFILLPLNLFEIFVGKIKLIFILFVLLISIFIINKHFIVCEYSFASLFSLVAYYFILIIENKMKKLTIKNDELKEKNYRLLMSLNNQMEYKNQIIYTSQLQERNNIAQEIHDKLGHSISGSLMQLEAAKLIMDKDSNQSKAIIQTTINVLRDGMDSIRYTLKNIKPEAEQLGINKIKLLVDEFNNKTKINANLYYSNNLDRISYIEWKVICDNIKETFTNIIKYSEAKNVKVNVEVLNTLLKVEIKDDGIGCIIIKKDLGLSGIEERTMNLNGKVILDGSSGFSVIILLPI